MSRLRSRRWTCHRCQRAAFADRFTQGGFQSLRHIGQALIGRGCGFRRGDGRNRRCRRGRGDGRGRGRATGLRGSVAVRRAAQARACAIRCGALPAILAGVGAILASPWAWNSSGGARGAGGRLRDGGGGRVVSSSASAASVSRCGRGGGSAGSWKGRGNSSGRGSSRGVGRARPRVPAAAARSHCHSPTTEWRAAALRFRPAGGPPSRAVPRRRARYWVRRRRRSGRRSSTNARHCRAAPE